MTLLDDAIVDSVALDYDADGNAFLRQGNDVIGLSERQQIKLIVQLQSNMHIRNRKSA